MSRPQPGHPPGSDHARLEEGLRARAYAESVPEAQALLGTGLTVDQVLALVEQYGPQAVAVAKQLWDWWQSQKQLWDWWQSQKQRTERQP